MECEKTGTLASGAIVLCAQPDGQTLCNDILDSILFAQLYADKSGLKFDNPTGWLADHDNAMRQLKWALMDLQSIEFRPEADQPVDVGALIKEKWLVTLSIQAADSVRKILLSLGSPVNEAPWAVFKQYSCKASHIETLPNDPPATLFTWVIQLHSFAPEGVLSSLYLSYQTRSSTPDVMPFQPSSDQQLVDNIDLRLLKRQWNGREYQKVRAGVDTFLTGKRSGLLMPVTLQSPDAKSISHD